MYISSTSSLLVLPITEKHHKIFGFTKTVDRYTPREARPKWFALESSLAPSGVGFTSLYYVSLPQGRGKSSRTLMRKTSDKRTRA